MRRCCSISLSLSLSLSPSVSLFLSISIPLSLSLSLSLSFSIYLSLSLFLSLAVYLSFSHSLSISKATPSVSPLVRISSGLNKKGSNRLVCRCNLGSTEVEPRSSQNHDRPEKIGFFGRSRINSTLCVYIHVSNNYLFITFFLLSTSLSLTPSPNLTSSLDPATTRK